MKASTKAVKNACAVDAKKLSEVNIAYARNQITKIEYIQRVTAIRDELVKFLNAGDWTQTAKEEIKIKIALCERNIAEVTK